MLFLPCAAVSTSEKWLLTLIFVDCRVLEGSGAMDYKPDF